MGAWPAIFWTVLAGGRPWATGEAGRAPPVAIFPLFGLLFVGAGLYFVAARFVVDAWLRGRTRYAVTDRRIRRPRGWTIRFGPSTPLFGRASFGVWSPALDPTPQFLAIPDARGVFDLIRRRTAPAR